jgi:hypothetical protein
MAGMAIEMPCSDRSGAIVRYRNRTIREADLEFLRTTIAQHGSLTRTELWSVICRAWDWRQANGGLSLLACQDLLLRLSEWGHIELPRRPRPKKTQRRPLPLPQQPLDWIPLRGAELRKCDANLDALVVRPLADEERLGWRLYMDRYHYLGHRTIVGEHVLYAALLGNELVALLAWASAALHVPLREQYIGWDEQTKRRRLHLVANNVRFLVLPWVKIPLLASKILAANLRRLSSDWQRARRHPIYLAETFVDTARFRGTCYRASNWRYLGQTAGRSKRGNAYPKNGAPKALYVYPLHRRASECLRERPAKDGH